MVRTRKIVTFDPVWDDTLKWYERAVGVMAERGPTDVTSWFYQAAIHGTTRRPTHDGWSTCEHGGWYFFPWHRGYLVAFEEIVRSIIIDLGGPADWALPYWDYEQAGKDVLPPAFRTETKPDGTANNLFTDQRFTYVKDGFGLNEILSAALGSRATLSSVAGREQSSFSGNGVVPDHPFGFGGGPTPSLPDDEKAADIEQSIHGTVHVLVGGNDQLGPGVPSGLMAAVETAALDPIFWLHHANIDRMWSEWAANPAHANPDHPDWRTQPWTYFRPDGTTRGETAESLQDTTTASLGYRYDTIAEAVPPLDAITIDAMGDEPGPGEPRSLQPVGWSQPITLTGHEANAEVAVDRATMDTIAPPGLDAPAPARTYLELSDIDVPTVPGIVYGVYLHQQGTEPSDDDLAGVASFFTAGAANSDRRDRPEHRLRYVFDVTDIVAGEPADTLTVTFRPVGATQLAAALRGLEAVDEPDAPPVSIGRVALLMG